MSAEADALLAAAERWGRADVTSPLLVADARENLCVAARAYAESVEREPARFRDGEPYVDSAG